MRKTKKPLLEAGAFFLISFCKLEKKEGCPFGAAFFRPFLQAFTMFLPFIPAVAFLVSTTSLLLATTHL